MDDRIRRRHQDRWIVRKAHREGLPCGDSLGQGKPLPAGLHIEPLALGEPVLQCHQPPLDQRVTRTQHPPIHGVEAQVRLREVRIDLERAAIVGERRVAGEALEVPLSIEERAQRVHRSGGEAGQHG